jgi:drug/metabolite transporter (DMT)-like permease
MTYLIALICVLGIAAGQILFKMSATSLKASGSFFDPQTLLTLFSAFALYGITTIGWVWVLQKVELGKVYPLMALAFVIVPLGSHYFFAERFQPQYFVGIVLIMSGIFVATRS